MGRRRRRRRWGWGGGGCPYFTSPTTWIATLSNTVWPTNLLPTGETAAELATTTLLLMIFFSKGEHQQPIGKSTLNTTSRDVSFMSLETVWLVHASKHDNDLHLNNVVNIHTKPQWQVRMMLVECWVKLARQQADNFLSYKAAVNNLSFQQGAAATISKM